MVTATEEKDEKKVLGEMKKRVDRLMFAIQRDIKDSDFRFELVTDLITIRRKIDERNGDDGRTSD